MPGWEEQDTGERETQSWHLRKPLPVLQRGLTACGSWAKSLLTSHSMALPAGWMLWPREFTATGHSLETVPVWQGAKG